MADSSVPPSNVQPSEAKSLLDNGGYTLLDVRTPEEFAQGSVPGSINVPVKFADSSGGWAPNPNFVEQVKEHIGSQSNPALVCTCAHGRRGADAAGQLAAAGLQQVVNLDGGLARWSDEALPHSGTIKRHH